MNQPTHGGRVDTISPLVGIRLYGYPKKKKGKAPEIRLHCDLLKGNTGEHTVDGRNPAPVDMVNIPLFTQLYISQLGQDFFHQQYVLTA